ncbi:MAG TPA: HPP family protein [Patescibacteria group bacterium]|nr:HPP family protein [Patescibacteria group bacterium]
MRRLIHRHQPSSPAAAALKAGLGGVLGIALVAWLSHQSGVVWLMAPLGATCVLLFSAPGSPFSQPANVVGGHVLSTLIGLAVASVAPTEWWSLGLAVGLAIAAMHLLRLTHPPAGADPIVVLLAHPGWSFVVFPVLAGSVALVLCALTLHHLPPRTAYPLPVPKPAS